MAKSENPAAQDLQGSPHDRIEAALKRWAYPAVPDYASFSEWVTEKLTINDRNLILPQLRSNGTSEAMSYVQTLLDLHSDYETRVRAANQTNATAGESYRLLFNSFKLLIHATEGFSARTKDTLALVTPLPTATVRLDD